MSTTPEEDSHNTTANHFNVAYHFSWEPSLDESHTSNEINSLAGLKSPTSVDLQSTHATNFPAQSPMRPFFPPTPHGSAFFGGAADLHGQSLQWGMPTPISASASNTASIPSREDSMSMGDLVPQTSPGMVRFNHSFDAPPGFAAGAFPQFSGPSAMQPAIANVNMSDLQLAAPVNPSGTGVATTSPLPAGANENFRFRIMLKAPTAMVRSTEETPVTYLNKNQTYSIYITDTAARRANPIASRYRTAIRVAFEDEHQRSAPTDAWDLWKEGRGKNEAYKRSGRLQAIEFVRPESNHGGHAIQPNVQLVNETFDGFSVEWTPNFSSVSECMVQARFHFLSTDFSHSKGVKGFPLRLCAKTEVVDPGPHMNGSVFPDREISYCIVKTFRDHGSERKLQNDRAHVKKCVDKVRLQIEESEAGATKAGGSKRLRVDSGNTPRTKVAKHKRDSSATSIDSDDDENMAEGELQAKIRTYESMTRSMRPVSFLHIAGDESDDLDTHPVVLRDLDASSLAEMANPPVLLRESTQNTGSSSNQSPPASAGMAFASPVNQAFQRSPQSSSFVKARRFSTINTLNPQQFASPMGGPVKVKTASEGATHRTSEWIDAVDVDATYQPPARDTKPVACFYVKASIAGRPCSDDYYRAIYLRQRSVSSLVHAIASKYKLGASRVVDVIRINVTGLRVKMDDELVQQMNEGQDFIADIDLADETPDSAADFLHGHEEGSGQSGQAEGYKIMLRF